MIILTWWAKGNPFDVSGAEYRALFEARLRALERATKVVTGGDPLPVPWRVGWRAKIEIQGRTTDHSLSAVVRCYCPEGKMRLGTRVRVQRRQALPYVQP